MAINHQALDLQGLSAPAFNLVGPQAKATARKMVAQGLAPLAPRDMGLALYQLWVSDVDGLGGQAKKTLEGLPEQVILGMLDAQELPGEVIDWITRRRMDDDAILGRVLEHPNTDDDTWEAMASVGSEVICERIAANQTRWMQAPGIVSSLYENPSCRQSLIHRVLEFAVRAQLDVPIPMMEEIRKAMLESSADPSRDAALAEAMVDKAAHAQRRREVAQDDEQTPTQLHAGASTNLDLEAEAEERRARHAQIRNMSPMEKIRAALLGSASDRAVLVRDNNKTVAMAAIKCPRVRDNEVVAYSSDRSLSNDVVRYIANRREWVKLYAVKVNLVMNPKTPLPRAMALLAMLSRKDLAKVARSKNVASALQKVAKRKSQSAA